MFKHVQYFHSRRSLNSEDGSQRSSLGSSRSSDGTSSRCSSSLSVGESHTGAIKVFCGILRPDVDYKTLNISSEDTSKDVVQMLLRKCKMRNRDPNLYYLSMEVSTQSHSGLCLDTTLILDDDARPLELKTCQPNGYSVRFTMRCRKGGLLKIHDTCLNSNSQYKSLLISQRTTAEEVIQMLLGCYDSIESPDNFALFEVFHTPNYYERKLRSQDAPLLAAQAGWNDEGCEYHLRRITPEFSRNPHFNSLRPVKKNSAFSTNSLPRKQTPKLSVFNSSSRCSDDSRTSLSSLNSNCYMNYTYI